MYYIKEVPMKDFVPIKLEKEVISVRLRSDMLQEIDAAADAADISRNEMITQCIAYALEHLSTDKS